MNNSVSMELPMDELEGLIYEDGDELGKCMIKMTLDQLKELLDKTFMNGMECGVEDYKLELKYEQRKQETNAKTTKQQKDKE